MGRLIRWIVLLVVIAGSTSLFAASSFSAGVFPKLIHPARVYSMEVSGNSQYVVYLTDTGLSRYDFATATNTTLNIQASLYDFRISPDSSRLLYVGVPAGETTAQLYSVPSAGGTSIRINAELVGSMRIQSFRISPDSSRVFFAVWDISNTSIPPTFYSAPADGSAAPVQVAADLPNDAVSSYWFSPDSSRIVFTAAPKANPDAAPSLYTTPSAGGPSTLLAADITGMELDWWRITPDSAQVVYLRTGAMDRRELYAVAIAGGAPYKLASPPNFSVDMRRYTLSATGKSVAFLGTDGTEAGSGLYVTNLVSNTLSPRLNNDGGSAPQVFSFEITPDESRVVYQRSGTVSNPAPMTLISSVVTTGVTTTLNGTLDPDWEGVESFKISPDGQLVAYVADQTIGQFGSSERQVYSVPVAGGVATQLSGGSTYRYGRFPEQDLRFTNDSAFVIYRAESFYDPLFHLFKAPADGSSAAQKLNGSIPSVGEWPNNDYFNYRVSADGRYVVFRGGNIADMFEPLALYVADSDAVVHTVYLPLASR